MCEMDWHYLFLFMYIRQKFSGLPPEKRKKELPKIFKYLKLKNDTELGLGFTHEEPIARIMSQFVSSYRDLPAYVYQFQTKFRNELRAKSGIMRGREFLMKDLYFSTSAKASRAVMVFPLGRPCASGLWQYWQRRGQP